MHLPTQSAINHFAFGDPTTGVVIELVFDRDNPGVVDTIGRWDERHFDAYRPASPNYFPVMGRNSFADVHGRRR